MKAVINSTVCRYDSWSVVNRMCVCVLPSGCIFRELVWEFTGTVYVMHQICLIGRPRQQEHFIRCARHPRAALKPKLSKTWKTIFSFLCRLME